jgi:hypothetical protein
MVMELDLPVPLSRADTLRIPLATLAMDQKELTINLKGDLDLWDTTGRWGNVGEVKFAKHVVVLGHGSFTLEYLNPDGGLVVDSGREDLGLFGRDDRVSADKLGHDTTSGLDTESQGADIDQEDAFGAFFAGKNTTLDSGSVGNGLIGVDSLGGLLAVKVFLEELLDFGNSGRTTNKYDLISFV